MTSDEMDCTECQSQVTEFLHSELGPEIEQKVMAHIANCDHCESHYDVENHFNQILREKCEVKTPEEIIEKIRQRLSEIN